MKLSVQQDAALAAANVTGEARGSPASGRKGLGLSPKQSGDEEEVTSHVTGVDTLVKVDESAVVDERAVSVDVGWRKSTSNKESSDELALVAGALRALVRSRKAALSSPEARESLARGVRGSGAAERPVSEENIPGKRASEGRLAAVYCRAARKLVSIGDGAAPLWLVALADMAERTASASVMASMGELGRYILQ